ncbi:MAG: efflux RND transporter permease subunit [Candidatus Electryonea clarkiae]|nr:efflux RND transporter permease subunit [Candidatus Electryonea clarkiae]MDP8288900.1 efflux RND transporter permease subunit [Candidatus Electryonea clarkiae]
MKLADISIKRPVMMTMVIMTFVVVGIFSLGRLGLDLMPDIDFPFISVVTIYPGAGPEEIEKLLNELMEEEISSISGVKNTFSTAQEGVSIIFAEFQLGQDVDIAAIDVKDKIDGIRFQLPDDIEEPVVQKFDMGMGAIVNLSVTGPYPLEDLFVFVDKTVKPELSKIPGLANIDIVGEKEREIEVALSAQKLRAFGISPLQVVMSLAVENMTLPVGRIESGRNEYTLRLSGEYDNLEELSAVQLMTTNGPVRLDRISRITDTFAEQRELTRFNNVSSIGVDIIKRKDANTVQVADLVYQALKKLESRLPEGVKIEVANDTSDFIRDSVDDVSGNLVMGILFTAIVLFVFLHSWRGTVIAAVAMPISIISTFILIDFAGFTINVMTLMGLAISVGILVVNAIVVLENIERYQGLGLSAKEAASKGTGEIAVAVTAATLTNIVVFTPMAFMQGIVGQIFKQFGLTVAFATAFSLLVSFTLTPMMASRKLKSGFYFIIGLLTFWAVWNFLGVTATIITASVVLLLLIAEKLGLMKRFSIFWDKWYDELTEDYRVGLKWALNHRFIIISAVGIVFLFGMFLFRFIGSEFFPGYDQRMFSVSVEMPAGARLEETNRVLYRIEKELEQYPEVETVYTALGKSSLGGFGGGQGVQYGAILVNLLDKEEGDYSSTADLIKTLRPRLADIPAAKIILAEASMFGGGGGSDIELQLQGDRMEDLEAAAARTIELIRNTGNAVDVRSDWQLGKPEIVVRPNRIQLSDRGGSVQDVAMTLRTLFEGMVSTRYREGGDEHDIRVRLMEDDRNRVDRVSDLLIPIMGDFVPLKDIASVEFGSGPTQITRKNKQRMVTISANVASGTMGELQAQIIEALELPITPPSQQIKDILSGVSSVTPRQSPKLPTGVTVYFGGEAEIMAESFSSLFQALILAIILTYMLLAAILESYRFPLIIMMTLPLGLAGVSMALVISGKSISMFSLMSIVMLVGIVVNNGILLIDYTAQLRKEGRGLREAVLEACPIRLRPILMSTFATSLGMLPLAIGLGAGGEFRAPMAIVAIGGLIVSTSLTLFAIPVMYTVLEAKGEKARILE